MHFEASTVNNSVALPCWDAFVIFTGSPHHKYKDGSSAGSDQNSSTSAGSGQGALIRGDETPENSAGP